LKKLLIVIIISEKEGNKDLLNLEYEGFPRDTDDAVTEVDDAASVASEATLLGTLETKEKGKEYEASAQFQELHKVEKIEARPYLCGLFRFSTTHSRSDGQKPKRTPKSRAIVAVFSKVANVIAPGLIKNKRKLRHEHRIAVLLDQIKRCAIKGTLLTDPTLLSNPLLPKAIRETEILSHAASLSGKGDLAFLKFLLYHGALANGPPTGLWLDGFTPLGRAVRSGTPEACEILIKAGAKSQAALYRLTTTRIRLRML
jgi:hypothetical protein